MKRKKIVIYTLIYMNASFTCYTCGGKVFVCFHFYSLSPCLMLIYLEGVFIIYICIVNIYTYILQGITLYNERMSLSLWRENKSVKLSYTYPHVPLFSFVKWASSHESLKESLKRIYICIYLSVDVKKNLGKKEYNLFFTV